MRVYTLKIFMYPFSCPIHPIYTAESRKINTTRREGRNEFKHTTQIDVDMAKNFVAEEPTPLLDSEQPESVKRCQLVQQTPKPRRPF